jgi:hypothetical protein
LAYKGINVLLSLIDKFTDPAQRATSETKKLQRQVKQAANVVGDFGTKVNKTFLNAVKGVSAMGTALAGAAIGTGFKEAFDLEGYRLQLETATKDTKKAADIMTYSIDLANKTPFEGGELVEAASKFESMSMSAKKWLPLAGDMAAATNKDFDQATEALIDAQTGELERLKEFGIKKADITKKAGEMFKNVEVVNNKGQIVDQEKFNEAMTSLMQDKFAGGMEKQATTVKGLWSTVTGVTKSALAQIVGMSTDGSIAAGSPLEKLKEIIKKAADAMAEFQQSGQLEQISKQVSEMFTNAVNFATTAVKWLKDNMDWLLPTAKGLFIALVSYNILVSVISVFKTFTTVVHGLTAAFTLLKGVKIADAAETLYLKALYAGDFVKSIITGTAAVAKNTLAWIVNKAMLVGQKVALLALKGAQLISAGATAALTAAQWALNAAFIASPIGWVVLGIGALIAVGVLLYKNWDAVKGKASELWDKITEVFGGIRDSITGAFDAAKEKVYGFFTGVEDKLNNLAKKVQDVPVIGTLFSGAKYVLGVMSDPKKAGRHATGTSYFSGGQTRINEGGRGEIVNLPNGTQIVPHDVATKQNKNININVSLNVQGNMIGNEQYADYIGGVVANKVIAAYGNM